MLPYMVFICYKPKLSNSPGTVDPRLSLSVNVMVEWLAVLFHMQEVTHTVLSLKASYSDRPSCSFLKCFHINWHAVA